MKLLIVSAIVAGMALSPIAGAFAQDQDHPGDHGGDHKDPRPFKVPGKEAHPPAAQPAAPQAARPPQGGRPPQAAAPAPQQQPRAEQRQGGDRGQRPQAPNPPVQSARPDDRNRGFPGGRPPENRPHEAFQGRPDFRGPPGDHERPREFSRRDYQRNFEAPHPFHFSGYDRPRGWYDHRWVFGERLPPLFWARNYWIDNFWEFDLAPPPYGYEWVRYGDDALLIDVQSGVVLQSEYGVFD